MSTLVIRHDFRQGENRLFLKYVGNQSTIWRFTSSGMLNPVGVSTFRKRVVLFFFLDCLMLKMKPLGFITTAVAASLSTGCYIQENLDLRHQRCEIHKSRSFWYLSVFRDTGLICLSSITISRTAVGLNQTTVCWIAHLYAFLFARCSEQITPVLYTVPLASVFGFEDYWIKVSERLQIVTPFLHVVTCIFSNQQYMSKHKRSFAKPLPHGKNKTNS